MESTILKIVLKKKRRKMKNTIQCTTKKRALKTSVKLFPCKRSYAFIRKKIYFEYFMMKVDAQNSDLTQQIYCAQSGPH